MGPDQSVWGEPEAIYLRLKAGYEAALEKVTASYPKDGPIVWVNMRQEPSVYVNGQPMCARPSNKETSLKMTLIMMSIILLAT